MRIELIGDVFDRLDVAVDIQHAEEDVDLIINTEGGSVFEGLQIVNAIQNCKYKVNAEVQVMACSIGAVIALACDNVKLTKNDIVMVHNCWTVAIGGKKELQAEIESMEVIDTILQNIISDRCNDKTIRDRMDEGDVWLTGEQVADMFEHVELIDRVRPIGLVASGSVVDLINKFNILREKVSEMEKNAEKQDKTDEKPENSKEEPEYIVTDELKALLAKAGELE